MWNNFRNWYISNQVEINWFLTGSLTAFGIVDLSHGNYVGALINFALAWGPYFLKLGKI